MELLEWIIAHWVSLFEHGAIAVGLLFTGLSYHVDTKERRLNHHLRFTEQHHKILSDLITNPQTARIFDTKSSVATLTEQELHGVNFLLLHLQSSFRANKAGLYRLPEQLDSDVMEFLSMPIPKAAWSQLKPSYNKDFVRFVDHILTIDRRR